MTLEKKIRALKIRALAVVLCLFTLAEVNYPHLQPQSQLAIFAGLGLALCFLCHPMAKRYRAAAWSRALDWALVVATFVPTAYVVVQTEPAFERFWLGGASLGDRAGAEKPLDHAIGVLGLVLILEATRRVVGWALPVLAVAFLAYGHWGQAMPAWLFPHRGYGLERLVSQSFLHSQGVFGIALRVMLTYVFLFVVFGALLEATGATRFIIDWTRRLFGKSAGAPAKVAILSSGLMGSLSGSAVANTATTGTFTIPLMRSAGFSRQVAGGIEAAASSGGALVPPVMGAGAYMMLEIVDPPVTYLEIIRAAVLPAILYYLSLFLIVHLTSRKMAEKGPQEDRGDEESLTATVEAPAILSLRAERLSGVIFFASLASLVGFLLAGFTVFRAVTVAMAVVWVLSFFHAETRLTLRRLLESFERAARGGTSLVAAAASVGILLGVVTLTGVGSRLPATIIPLAESNLFLALLLIMVSSLVLGMGLPSAVCYLLLATLIGPALGGLGVPPLAAHFFIFYFGLMSMVTPPVALAAYTAASIAGSKIMATALQAFRFSLIGFFLPFLFVYRPELLTLAHGGGRASWMAIAGAFALVAVGIVPLAAGLSGYFGRRLGIGWRAVLLLAALAIFEPLGDHVLTWLNVVGLGVFAAVAAWLLRGSRPRAGEPSDA